MKQPNPKDKAPSFNQVEKEDFEAAGRSFLEFAANFWIPPFRVRVGDRYYRYGVFNLAGMAMLIQSPCMMAYIAIWLFCLLAGGVNKDAHSRWGGWSRVKSRFLEPVIVLVAGVVFATFDEVFALFCFGSATAMALLAIYEWQQVNLYRRKMRDAEQEMAWMSQVRRGR